MSAVDNLTKEELLSEEIMQSVLTVKDRVEQQRMLIALQERAKKLGCTGAFKDLFKAFKRDRQAATQHSHETDFTMPTVNGVDKYDQLRCGEWQCDDTGIVCMDIIGRTLEACPHPIFPVKLLQNAQDDKVKIVLAFRRSNGWREITVDKSTTSSANKIVALSDFGIQVTTENSKQLVKYLNDIESYNPDRVKFYQSTSKLGWTSSGEFMPYCQNVIFDAENSVASVYGAIEQRGSYEAWKSYLRQIRAKRKVEVQLYMAAAFASPYISRLGILPFIVNLFGATGNGKTVAAMLATSIWANPEVGRYITKAGGTLTSLEVYLDLINDLPAVIDDFAQIKKQSSRSGPGQVDFGDYVYMLCSGSSKGRSNVSLGLQRTRTWRNCILTNSEQSLIADTSQGGMINRIIEFESEDIIFDGDLGHRTAEFVKQNYGFAGKDMLDRLDVDELRESWRDFTNRIAERSKKTGDAKEEKQILPMALLLAIDKAVTDLIFEDGIYMDFDTAYSMLKSHEQVSDMERAYLGLIDLITINRSCFAEGARECWGKYLDDSEKQIAIIPYAFNSMCSQLDIGSQSFRKWLAKMGYIEVQDSAKGRATKVVKIGKASVRCIVINMPDNVETDSEGFMKCEEDDLPF